MMLPLLRTEVRLLLRGGFAAAYVVVAATYLGILHALPEPLGEGLLPVLVFSDPAVLGLMIVGALVLLERREGVLRALSHTPTSHRAWIAAKVLGLTGLSVVVALGVAWGSGHPVHPGLLLLAVVPTSVLSVLVGIVVVSRVRTFNGFLALVAVATAPLGLPAMELLLGAEWPWLRFTPTGPTAELLRASLGAPLSPAALARDVVVLAVSCLAAAAWANAWTARYLWRSS